MTDDIATLQQRLAGARLAITVLRDALTQARVTDTSDATVDLLAAAVYEQNCRDCWGKSFPWAPTAEETKDQYRTQVRDVLDAIAAHR